MKLLVTGSSGLIGSAAVEHFHGLGWEVVGVDNNGRADYFGPAGDTLPNLHRLAQACPNFIHEGHDIRDYDSLEMHVFQRHGPFDAVIHCAAQPSHDKAREIPLTDFGVNALGTVNLLELHRLSGSPGPFVYMSTNKVYGDAPNELPLVELETRWDAPDVDETMRLDASTHSLFGASKAAADLMVQEYGRTYGMPTACLRGGCLTGPHHAGVELHGFLSYLVRCVLEGRPYTVNGYRGKQVRDNIHALDVVRAMEAIIAEPRVASVYNLGGGRANSVSMLEAIAKVEEFTGLSLDWKYSDQHRLGDHICYISDLRRFQADYPGWSITKSLDRTLLEIIGGQQRGTTERYIPGDGGDGYFESYAQYVLPWCRGKVLDVGCGHGFLTQRIAERPGTLVLGTDCVPGWRAPHPKASYQLMDTAVQVTLPGEWDTVVATEHVEHLEAGLQERFLEWVASHLAPGGHFVGSMPDPDDEANPNPFHKRTWAASEWEARLRERFGFVQLLPLPGGYAWVAAR